ncbi:MAG: metallopeptidase TldD-related protein [Gammaproteobacteria bacterium]
MQDYFSAIADVLGGLLAADEVYTCWYSGEQSDFVRFNQARIRQAGRVTQQTLNLDWIRGRRHAAVTLTLSGNLHDDRERLAALVAEARQIIAHVPDDPYLLYATTVHSSVSVQPDRLPPGPVMVDDMLRAVQGKDLVGIFARGSIHSGFANSFGQRNWLTRHSFNVDWSLHLRADKAIKARYAGFDWQVEELNERTAHAAEQLAILERPMRVLTPGEYRVFLSPMALEEIVELLAWGGFGLRAQRTGTSPLLRMVEEGARLHHALAFRENTQEGVAPDFDSAGFIRPPALVLIEGGEYRNALVSPRSAAEYGVPGNGANASEMPQSLDITGGDLARAEVLSALGTGLYIGNLWYLNYSDRNAARITGMTRFGTFWVEHGRIQAPVNVMRFDDTVYRLLGDRLLALTREREWLLDPGTYGGRSSRSARLPGALIEAMRFTL